MTGFGDGVGDHLFHSASNQHLYQLFYCGHGCVPLDTWIYQDITQMAGNAPLLAVESNLSSFAYGTQEHVFYFGTNQHVYQVVTPSGGGWVYQDLTAASGGAVAASGSSLSSFGDSVGQHVFYQGANGHIYQLYYGYNTGYWVDQDLTAMTGGPVAVSGTALTSFADSQEHTVYQGTNKHIYQFVTHPGGWLYQDLTVGALPIANSPLTSFAQGGNEYVLYLTAAGQHGYPICESFYNGSSWSGYVLASYALGNNPPTPVINILASAGVTNLHDDIYYFVGGGSVVITGRTLLGPNGGNSVDPHFPLPVSTIFYVSPLVEYIEP